MNNTENLIEEIKPFKQIPYCEQDTKLSITGSEFVAIQNVINMHKASVDAIQSVFDRNINEGNITIKYIDQNGNEITKEEATKYLKKASEYLKNNEKTPN